MTTCCGADADKNPFHVKTANTIFRLIDEYEAKTGLTN